MLTSSRNCSSGSAAHSPRAAPVGADAAMPPAEPTPAAPRALRSHWRPRHERSPSPPRRLAQDRLGFGDGIGAVVVGFDILDGDRAARPAPCDASATGIVDVARWRPPYRPRPPFWTAIGSFTPALRTRTSPKVERSPERLRSSATAGLPSVLLEPDVGDPGLGLEVAEADDDRDGHAVDRGQLELDALHGLVGLGATGLGRRDRAEQQVDAIFAVGAGPAARGRRCGSTAARAGRG